MAVFSKVVVANRGAVAARVLRALDALGVHSLAVYSGADRGAPWLEMASETAYIGGSPARESYLNPSFLGLPQAAEWRAELIQLARALD